MFLAEQAPIIVRLAPKKDPTGLADVLLGALGLTGALVLGGTRVRLVRTKEPGTWIQFSAQDREERVFGHR